MTQNVDVNSKIRLEDLTPDELETLAGKSDPNFLVIDVEDFPIIALPDTATAVRILRIGDDLYLLQPDETVIVLRNGATASARVLISDLAIPLDALSSVAQNAENISTLADVNYVSPYHTMFPGFALPGSGSAQPVLPHDPLLGLPYNPLLPPTQYDFEIRDDFEGFAGIDDDKDSGGPTTPELSTSPLLLSETDTTVGFVPSDFLTIEYAGRDIPAYTKSVTMSLRALPDGTLTSAGQLIEDGAGTLTLEFQGTLDQFNALTVTLPQDFSSQSRIDAAEGPLPIVFTVTNIADVSAVLIDALTVTPEGDVDINDTLPDEVPDETDAPTLVTPASLLLPELRDIDSSEALALLRLVIEGMPGTVTVDDLALNLPSGAEALLADGGDGSQVLSIEISDASGDVLAAYEALTLTLPKDFSTANRSDLTTGATSRSLNFSLFVQTDEDQDATTDTPVDGTALASRDVDIGFEADIDLVAPLVLTAREDDGVPNSDQGVTVDLQIQIDITDEDGSETADTSDPRFAASVLISFFGLPSESVVNTGVLNGTVWTGTVAEANELELGLPGDYSGTILNTISVRTPEGQATQFQLLEVTPTEDIVIGGEIVSDETDAPLELTLSEFISIVITDPDEDIATLEASMTGLPKGTRLVDANGNDLGMFFDEPDPDPTNPYDDTVRFEFIYNATSDAYDIRQVKLILPTDYSTENPGATPVMDLLVNSTDGSDLVQIPLTVNFEGDLTLDGALAELAETDAPVLMKIADFVLPVATDADTSESVTAVAASISGLPDGTRVSTDNGASFTPLDQATYNFVGSLDGYSQIVIEFPTDFSTANPPTDVFGYVGAITDEGATGLARLDVTLDDELDVSVTAPSQQTFAEDGDGIDGGGVTVDMQIEMAVSDLDGSEDSTRAQIDFLGLPQGTTVNVGTLNGVVWSGTPDEANELELHLPGDYSGTILATIFAFSPEGLALTTQTITVTPTGDIDFDIVPADFDETDRPVLFFPSGAWKVSVSDTDLGIPEEVLTSVTLTLSNMPAGVAVLGTPDSTITYDPTTGGDFVFSGSAANFRTMLFIFETDFSTTSRHDGFPEGDIVGTLAATSTDDPIGSSEPVTLTITAEGDVIIDDSGEDTVPNETDAPIVVTPNDLLAPQAIDLDGSESLISAILTVTGLPGPVSLSDLAITAPSGAELSLIKETDGSQTLTITLTASNVGDVEAAYQGLSFTLPADFSTANRNDLGPDATSLPLEFTLDVQTDEDRDPTTDTPNDGTATASRIIEIDYEVDINLANPTILVAQEDGGEVGGDDGVTVDLAINVAITDADGSETADTSDPRFAASVTIAFTGLPDGATANTGTFNGAEWTGSVADVNDLQIYFPGNFNGTVFGVISVTTAEGTRTSVQLIEITPVSDVIIEGEVIVDETDAPLEILLSDFIDVVVTDPGETLILISATLPGLPAGTLAIDASGDPVGTLTPDDPTDPDSLLTFEYNVSTARSDPTEVRLVLPTDYSTENPGTVLLMEILAQSNEGGPVEYDVPLVVNAEGDLEVQSSSVALQETDAPVVIRLADYVVPIATDQDGSESVTNVKVVLNSIPSGARYSTDGGTAFRTTEGELVFDGPLADYLNLQLEFPTDFSSENPASELFVLITGETDEGAIVTGRLDITLDAEGDIEATGTGLVEVQENDPPGVIDEDATTIVPVEVKLTDAVSFSPTDADGSESVACVSVTLNDIPPDTLYSLNGGVIWTPVPDGSRFVLDNLTFAEYEGYTLRFADDTSTATDITGQVIAWTDEAILAGESDVDDTDGVATVDITIRVEPEADIKITGDDIALLEDTGQPIDLGLDAFTVDIDGSEILNEPITVSFFGLPSNGDTVLSDDTILTPASPDWTGTRAELQNLGIKSLPQHFSGIIEITVLASSNESGGSSAVESFDLSILPVAENTLDLTIDTVPDTAIIIDEDHYSIDEDTSFVLRIEADTADKDGSEQLTTLVIENLPPGWAGVTSGPIDPSRILEGASDIASAVVSGTRLTLTFNDAVTSFSGAVELQPLEDDDRDVETILGSDLVGALTSIDTAFALPSDSLTSFAAVDIDVDAVVDPIDVTIKNRNVDERTDNSTGVNLNIKDLALQDSDGSERFTNLRLTFTVTTASETYFVGDSNDFELVVRDGAVDDLVIITKVSVSGDTVVYDVIPTDSASNDQIIQAYEALRINLPQHFSGQIATEGTFFWSETTTGDVEINLDDNPATYDFTSTQTVRPIAESSLTAAAFVLSVDDVADGGPTSIEAVLAASLEDQSLTITDILTMLESTDDGSGEGQIELYLRTDVATPDVDGSEQLTVVKIANIPTDWIADHLSGTDVLRSAFFTTDGFSPIEDDDWDKLSSATYDSSSGLMTLTFVPDVTDFNASLQLLPTLYEDYDVDHNNSEPFAETGQFFGQDLIFKVLSTDTNTVTTDTQTSQATLDVDADPVNNKGYILTLPSGVEGDIDAANGIWQFGFVPAVTDTDGSETVTAVLLVDTPAQYVVYVTDPENPTGPKIPALLTATDPIAGLNTWSLDKDQWLDVEVHGIERHSAGPFDVKFGIVTTEADGGGTGVTLVTETVYIEPTIDGGDPSKTADTLEDTPVAVPLDGNIIDNAGNSPLSPEIIVGDVIIDAAQADSFNRIPRFFIYDDSSGTPQFVEKFLTGGTLVLTPAEALNLFVQQGQDSNEPVQFDVTMTYQETLDPNENTTVTGTVSIDVTGLADVPDVDFQNPDPTEDPSSTITDDDIHPIYRPDTEESNIPNHDRVYGYAGKDNEFFKLDMRLTDDALRNGNITDDDIFTPATELLGTMTEQLFPDDFDGSETLYYVISDVDPSITFLNVLPSDPEGTTYVVSENQLANLRIVPPGVDVVTYFDMVLNTIVVEDDFDYASLTGTLDEILFKINADFGGVVVATDFTVVVLPAGGGGTDPCEPEQHIPLPTLNLIGGGDEDTVIELQVELVPDGVYDSLYDLLDLPEDVQGSFAFSIILPDGARIASDPPGAVYFDPITRYFVVDLEKLGIDADDPTKSEGVILFTPPEHESSPTNEFPVDETLGPDDPYDDLSELEYSMVLENITCGTTTTQTSAFVLDITPVPDGPRINVNARAFDEDTLEDLGLTVEGIDGGERLTGQISIVIQDGGGGRLFDADGNPLTGQDLGGSTEYLLDPDEIDGLQIGAAQHFSGELTVTISATTEDIAGSGTKTNTSTVGLIVVPIADEPEFVWDDTVIDPETNEPFVDESGTPTITAIEDVPFNLSSVLTADSPDQDGSEAVTIVLSGVPDYLNVVGPPGGGFIDNGDGSFTMTPAAYKDVTLELSSDHARTPDELDSDIPNSIPLNIAVTTLEVANEDTNTGNITFNFQVRPDADAPTLTADISPDTGEEDDGQTYTLTLAATTPDPHETLALQVADQALFEIYVDNVKIDAVRGVITIPTQEDPDYSGDGVGVIPAGIVTIKPLADVSGDLEINVEAVTTDTGALFTDTQGDTADLILSLTPTGDIELEATPVVVGETDAPIEITPSDDWTITITDGDGNAPLETVDTVTLSLDNMPKGVVAGGVPAGEIAYDAGSGGSFVFTGSEAQYLALTLDFPADFNTDVRYDGMPTGPIIGTLHATSTEDAAGKSIDVSVEISAEVDLTVTIEPEPDIIAPDGDPIEVEFGIDAQITSALGETLETVVVTFDDPLPAGTVPSAGTISGNTLTLTRGGTSPADFAQMVAMLAITLPADFSEVLAGSVLVSTSDGDGAPVEFEIDLNEAPMIDTPYAQTATDPEFVVLYSDLLGVASDPDTPLTLSDFSLDNPDASFTESALGLTITVPNGFIGDVTLNYAVSDSNPDGIATTPTSAVLTIDSMQMEVDGTLDDPDGTIRARMNDVTGGDGANDIAKGTSGDDAVQLDLSTPYVAVDGFDLMGGSDFIDLSNSTRGFSLTLGDGDDWALGAAGNDTINGGSGQDILQGNRGANQLSGGADTDRFVITDLLDADQILDYSGGSGITDGDQIDLSALVALSGAEEISDFVAYDNVTGKLDVEGQTVAVVETGAGFAADVEVIFTNAANEQESAVI